MEIIAKADQIMEIKLIVISIVLWQMTWAGNTRTANLHFT